MKLLGNCVHHWVFETPSGPTSKGVCKKCGKKQIAENHMETALMASFKMKSKKKNRKFDLLSEADEQKV
jgi:hypothetical protein